jgi:hypothetical protein
MLDLDDIIQPYIYNLIYDYDTFIEAQNGSDIQKNKFLKHTSKIVVELVMMLPNLNFDQSERVEGILSSYIKMQHEIYSSSSIS